MLKRHRLTAALAIVAAAALAAPAPAGAEGRDNHVIVINQVDGRAATQAHAAVARDGGPTADAENVALARASCTDCRTVAVAVQVAVIQGSVSDFAPVNAAVALNEQCTRCQTYAYARQEVIAVDGPFVLSAAGLSKISDLEAAIERAAGSNEPFLQLGDELDGLVIQLRDVVRSEISLAGRQEQGHSTRRDADVAA